MIRTCLFLAAAVLSYPAGVAAEPKMRPWPKEPAAVFGLRLGQPLSPQDVPDCTGTRDPNAPPPTISFCKMPSQGSRTLSVVAFGVDVFQEGHLTIEDGIATKLTITARHRDYDDVRSLLTERYGPPSLRQSDVVKTRAGATFPDETLIWRGKQLRIHLMERAHDIDTTAIVFEHIPSAALDEQRRREKTKEDAAKM